MPHFTLDYSANLSDLGNFSANACLASVNAALAESGHFEEIDIKSRAFKAEQFLVGVQPHGRAFVAGTLSILTGRSEETRRQLGAIALEALEKVVPHTPGLHIQLSVEVVEIQREIYSKTVISA